MHLLHLLRSSGGKWSEVVEKVCPGVVVVGEVDVAHVRVLLVRHLHIHLVSGARRGEHQRVSS